ncbi:hypothetical protein [Amycolatopsis sp. NPDC059021]|uniref:hypothetical protein n=1 Tax=Amycolatopsis sp. NPDC059021 TaxID=3346704 RepID=UPI00366E03DA
MSEQTNDGWRLVRAIQTIDAEGNPTMVFFGLIEKNGKHEPALRINGGPAALMPLHQFAGDLVAALRKPLADWYLRQGGQS